MSHTLDNEWYDYFDQLNEAEKKSIISLIKTFLKRHNEEGVGNITIDEYNEEIEESLKQAAAGNYISQKEMEEKASKW